MTKKPKKPIPTFAIVAIDLLLTASLLLSFCYFHHVKKMIGHGGANAVTTGGDVFTKPPRTTAREMSTVQPVTRPPLTGDVTANPPDTDVPGPTYDMSGDFGERFGMLFSADDSVTITDNSYKSHNVYMTLTSFDGEITQAYRKGGVATAQHVVYYIIDVYVRNIENLYTQYASNYVPMTELVSYTKQSNNLVETIAAISGDLYYGFDQSKRIVVRNGTVVRKSDYITSDICVLYWDGSMETITPEEYNWDSIAAKGPYQIWSFGPELIGDDGKALENINSDVWRFNPRAAIGCVEPGHYVLAAVNGYRYDKERAEHGVGVNLDVLAKIMEGVGCTVAYNLDGGASTYAWYRGDMLVKVANGNGSERYISDIICIGEIRKENS